MSDDSFLSLFAPEDADSATSALPTEQATKQSWKVLLVDDEPDIHTVLHLSLRDVEVEGHTLELFDARSAAEAYELLTAHPDMALMLVDVVMESEEAGLDLVHRVRHDLGNRLTQIVVLTGQPGYAPQRDVVARYEIDGYRLKSELTADKLFVTVYAALRTHQALRTLVSQQRELEEMAHTLREREERLRAVVETAPDAIILLDERGTIFGWNDGAERIFGYTQAEMLGSSFLVLIPRENQTLAINHIERLRLHYDDELLSGRPIECVGLHKEGASISVELVLGSWMSHEERAYSAIVRDITARKRAESNLQLAASVYSSSYEGIVITDANHVVISVNPAYTRITGYTAEEVMGRPSHLLSALHYDGEAYSNLFRSLKEMDFWQGEVENRRKDGSLITEILSISVVRNTAGALTHYIEVFSDISQLKEHERELVRVANYDTLTGLPNRRLLADRLLQSMARSRRGGNSLAICYLDLDGFKRVNDEHGHAAGDRLLVEISERLKVALREDDTLARMGGDEFVFLLTGIEVPEGCRHVLDRVLGEISRPLVLDNHAISISASIGVTVFPADDSNADTLLRHADQAMYLAKEMGKNCCHFFDADHDREMKTHRLYLERIVQGFEEHEFKLFYQPKVDLQDGRVVGAEALIRWQHPERGLLLPADFLRHIEGNDLEIAVGEWVLDEAMRQLVIWQQMGMQLTVSVNISANHLLQANFADRLEYLLTQHPGIKSGALEIEILETTGLTDMKLAVQALGHCRKLGVQISLDDFGTGYSSLTYFLKLPVQSLKVDQSFVRGMLSDPNELGMVEGVVRLARAFNRPVIAEGVETLEHGGMLLSLNCPLAQGYGVARPMPAEAFPQWMAEWQQSGAWRSLAKPAIHGDLVLGVAQQCHRKWIDELINNYRHPESTSEIALDSGSCAFGRWYGGSGFARYGSQPGFAELGRQHERTHELAIMLLSSPPESPQAEFTLHALTQSSNNLMQALQQLGTPAV